MRHSIWRDGLIAGAIGATAVAVWFLLVDAIAGHPLYTPAALGSVLMGVLAKTAEPSPGALIITYTVFHYLAFIAVGLLAAVIVHWGDRQPGVLAGGVVLFGIIEGGFYGYTAILARSPAVGGIAWYQVAIGNAIAAVLMGTYLWKTHPSLGHEMDLALSGRLDT